MEWIEGTPPMRDYVLCRYVFGEQKYYAYIRPGSSSAPGNSLWKQTHYMVIEEPSVKLPKGSVEGFEHLPDYTYQTGIKVPDVREYERKAMEEVMNSQSEDLKPFKKAWDKAGEEAKKRTLTPDDRIDAMVDALNSQFEETEKKTAEHLALHTERLDTQAQALEKLMDIVNVLIKRVIAVEEKL